MRCLVAVDRTHVGRSPSTISRESSARRGGSISGCGVRSGRVVGRPAPRAFASWLAVVLRRTAINLAASGKGHPSKLPAGLALQSGGNCKAQQLHETSIAAYLFKTRRMVPRRRNNSLTYCWRVSGSQQQRSRCRCRYPAKPATPLRPRLRRLRVSECRRAAP